MALLGRLMARIRDTATGLPDQDFLDEAAHIDNTRCGLYQTFQAYYDGDHAVALTDRARTYLQASGLQFAENFCEPVVDAFAERLRVTGFTVEDKDAPAPAAGAEEERPEAEGWLAELWETSAGDLLQTDVHTVTLIKGDSFVIPDWEPDTGTVCLSWNQPGMINVRRDPGQPDSVAWASKRWVTDEAGPSNLRGVDIVRLNVYWPDTIWKLFRLHRDDGHGGWQPWVDADGLWEFPWLDATGRPLGVPVHHFRHKPLGDLYGRSELRSVIPQQDALNKQVVDLHDVLDYLAWPQRWIVSQSDSINVKVQPGDYLTIADMEAKLGQFAPADPAGVLAAIDQTLSRIARRSRTPLHLLAGGDMPSGEALKSAEAGLVSKALSAQVGFGQTWEQLMVMCLRLAAANGDQVAASAANMTGLTVRTQWDDPVSRNEKDEADTMAVYLTLGVSKRTILQRLGFDPEQEMEQRAVESEAALDTVASMMDRGGFADAGSADRGSASAGTADPS